MPPSLLRPYGHLQPAEILELVQRAPEILRSNPKAFSASPLLNLFSAPETAHLWTIYENLMVSCLRAGDVVAAQECLKRLVGRFGDKDERIMALQGLAKEATASSDSELEAVLNEYEALLELNRANIVSRRRNMDTSIAKRRSRFTNARSPCCGPWAERRSRLLPSTRCSTSTPRTRKPGRSWPTCTCLKGFINKPSLRWRRFSC